VIPEKITADLEKDYGMKPELTGSRFICENPKEDSDWDYVLQIKPIESEVAALVSYLACEGFKLEAGEHYQVAINSTFMSFRKGKLNFLVCANEDWCAKHRSATKLCKKLKLDKKEDRVAVFQALLYGNVEL
jgi:hypothetical protein